MRGFVYPCKEHSMKSIVIDVLLAVLAVTIVMLVFSLLISLV
jgi:hypothetical protein